MKATTRSRALLMTAVLAASPVLAACGEDATESSGGGEDGACVLRVGTLGPLTGPAADFGLSMEATAKFVADEANQKGGVQVGDKKCKVEVSSYDTGYTSAGAASGATEFASKGIKFRVIRPWTTCFFTG